jgi:dUTP pyrophosphatase
MKLAKLNPNLPTPKKSTDGAAGIDLYADIEETVVLRQGESLKISTGIAVEIPVGYAGLLLPRSGKGSSGMSLKNTAGVIDHDYRGKVIANTRNYESEDLVIEPGERFVQFLVVPVLDLANLEVVAYEDLQKTDRQDGGFGSTGKQ